MTRKPCPWYVSATAVRKYMQIAGARDFDDASDELIDLCAEVASRYAEQPDRKPRVTPSGLLVYRGPKPLRLQIIVSVTPRPEGPKPQVVDVRPSHDARRS